MPDRIKPLQDQVKELEKKLQVTDDIVKRLETVENTLQLTQRTDPAIQLGTNLHDLGLVNERARAYRSAAQTITTNTSTKIQYNTISYDPGNNFDNATNYNYTIPVDGTYFIIGSAGITIANDQKPILLDIHKNDAAHSRGDQIRSSGGAEYDLLVVDILELTLGDTVHIEIYHNDGANANTIANAISNYFDIHLISG